LYVTLKLDPPLLSARLDGVAVAPFAGSSITIESYVPEPFPSIA
jgi:hypothetical protein